MTQETSLRERLVDAGVQLVMTGGTASLGLREIARQAGVSHGAPRRYFPTHQALLSAIARRGFADLQARFAAATAGTTSPRGRLRALGRAYLGYALEHRGMFELMFRHELLTSEQEEPGRPRLRESTLPLFEHMAALVAAYRAEQAATDRPDAPQGSLPPASVTAAALWANLHGIAQLWAWGSLQLVLGSAPPAAGPTGGMPDGDQLDRLVAAALDAHLGRDAA
ncbi:TetR/AcrR family transcriptional regulator [Streptomyces cinnamoneus]|uniref:TetR/AcrR family transcriptional regulator n=1 Tax=Streptomyces cinnamoneus TaxID=53446 RepID=UPI00342697B7